MMAELVQDTINTAKRGVGGANPSADEESIARRYHSMVIDGRLRAAVRGLTNRDGGGVMNMEDIDQKSKSPVIDVLKGKHPEMKIPVPGEGEAFEHYDRMECLVELDCTEEIVQDIAGKMQGGAGPSSVDALALKKWLLNHGAASQILREELAAWTEWLSNGHPPWAAYRAMMYCRLVALDKCPGVRPVGIGEVWRRAIAKCVLAECGDDAKAACGSTQLCAGLEAGIEGAIHAVAARAKEHETLDFGATEVNNDIWTATCEEGQVQDTTPARIIRERMAAAQPTAARGFTVNQAVAPVDPPEDNGGEAVEQPVIPTPPEQEGLLLVDAKNGFNMLSRLGMLWTVRHRAGKMCRFSFNCYRHEIRLLCRRPGADALYLLSKEGVTQGDPMAMALYGIALLPLAEILRKEYPQVMQPWYADDAAMMGQARPVAGCFMRLQAIGPDFGYFPEAEKSYFICPLADEAAAKTVFEELELEIQYSQGEQYVGGFIGSTEMQDRWIEPKVQGWVEGVKSLARVATRYPQSAFAGFTQSLQSEW